MTARRDLVLRALEATDGFRSAQDLYADLRGAGERIGLTSVYRVLQAMSDDDEVDVLRTDTGEALYRRCGESHHHHLVCRGCGTTVEVTGASVERWASRTAAEHGFSDVAHTLELFGTCTRCQRHPSGEREAGSGPRVAR